MPINERQNINVPSSRTSESESNKDTKIPRQPRHLDTGVESSSFAGITGKKALRANIERRV